MKKNNKISTLLLALTVLFCISTVIETVSAAETENTGPTITTSLTGGTYNTTKTVTLTANDSNAIIYYTNDTTDPRTSSTRSTYTGPITISKTTTLRYAAVDTAGNWSKLYLQNYVIGTGKTNNTGQSNYTGPKTNNTKWMYELGEGVEGSPAIGADGTIYIGTINGPDHTGYFYAFNPNGTLKWKYDTDAGILGTPVIGKDGTIYVGTYWGVLYAFNRNGTVKWALDTYFSDTGENRTNVWARTIYSSPIIGADGTIYIATYNGGSLYAINPNGTVKWKCKVGNVRDSPAIGSDGTIYVGQGIGQDFYAINPDGTLKWTYHLNTTYGHTSSSPVIGSNGVIYLGDTDRHFYALNPNGTLKWYFASGGGIPSIGPDGTIYVDSWGTIYALNPDTGTEKWKYAVNGSTHGCTIGADGTIYFGSIASLQVYGTDLAGFSDLYALNPDGTLKWKYHAGGVASSPTIGPDGTLYVGSWATAKFYAIKDDYIKPTATANVKSGLYNTNKAITLKMSENGTIYYTLNGSTPTTSSTVYKGPISITSTTTLKFIAVDNAGNKSPVYTEKYTIDKIAPKKVSVYVKRYASGYSRTGTIAIKLNENIKTSINWSKVIVKNKYGKTVSITKWIKGNTLYIKTNSKRSSYSYYTVYIPKSAVKDYAGNNFAGYSFKFKTGKY
ncbi:PQQ-binding-like beta-propeller repeat protein [Methanobacterium sp.]|uniref:chitobiase/beta-hexosaminidase C-terminal domain-containing protein n=1 Tax=Methanobacterium sp. TaxID=2164 RepID=UPI003C79561B